MSRLIVALCALVTLARANYYVVHPIASTVYKAGKPLENGAEPLSNSFGQTRVSICTGNSTKQTCHLNVGTFTSGESPIKVKIPSTALCNDDHFVRFESVKATDKAGVPLLAFSAHFKVTGTKERKTISRNKGNSTSSSHSSVHSSTSSLPHAGNAAPAVASASAGQIEGDILTEEELIANSGAIKLSFSLFLTISLAVVYTLF